jgi:dynein heavy chain, axonemal
MESSKGDRPTIKSMKTCVGIEKVDFTRPLKLEGKVEIYLQELINNIKDTLQTLCKNSIEKHAQLNNREQWLKMDPAQITLLINFIIWCRNVEDCFKAIANGNLDAIKTLLDQSRKELTDLIKMVQGDLDRPLRQKIMCMITLDTHSRDVMIRLINENVKKNDEFQWQSQLKFEWDAEKQDARSRIADAAFWYSYEYLGNGPRLVVTPLTDRIYVTATQALHLSLGCAPAGPAGTGKTETTKDLSSALAKACYVFNCSPEMNYETLGNIFKGLASSGCWGCFDEFNRLVPEVLSVCSVQFKSVCDGVKNGSPRIIIEGDEVDLDPTCGAFITMNPGYLGRSELPEGLKVLFRPITVMVPDLVLICENMLMAEGFIEAATLANKFFTLYMLCRDLLSKAEHYDWGLRAIKSVLVVAGSFKRAEPNIAEEALLMRALRDFNIPKITAADMEIFFGLLGDLFPGVEVERKRNVEFE